MLSGDHQGKMLVGSKMGAKVEAEHLVTGNEESSMSSSVSVPISDQMDKESNLLKEQKTPLVSASSSALSISLGSNSLHESITECKKEDCAAVKPSPIEDDEERKSLAHLKNHHGKKKIKVDWTPELHGQFVKAVEQLGLDKAVPSKILELMGANCLTRHNVASHLQKYRTQQKILLAREAEVARLRQRRQVYGTTERTVKQDANPWIVPTTGFPPVKSMLHSTPSHVWGYPSVSQSWSYMWSNHQAYSPQPPSVWAPAHPMLPVLPGDHSSWYYYHQDVIASGTPCFPHHSSMTYTTQTVPGLPPTGMYRVDTGIGVPIVPSDKRLPQPSFDSYPSNESIDEVIEDVLSKPWLPLPLGLKPPSIEGILVELQRQGISTIPTDCAT